MICMEGKFMSISKRKGFTLVELLIVIVVIGILSAMMMLSSTEAVTSAKVNNIVSNLRNWKTAALSWYMDNIDRVDGNGNITKDANGNALNANSHFAENVKPSEIAKYLNGEFTECTKTGKMGAYAVKDGSGVIYETDHINDGKTWLIGCQFAADDHDKRLLQKLEAHAASAGLIYKGNYEVNKAPKYTATGDNRHFVWIEVIDFRK